MAPFVISQGRYTPFDLCPSSPGHRRCAANPDRVCYVADVRTEKTFRVADYRPYSDYQRWTSIFKQGYNVARLANPTGISASKGEVLCVYVGAIPSGQTVALEAVTLGAAQGTQTTLREGLNVVEVNNDVNLFLYHSVDNTTSGAAPFTALSNYTNVLPPMR